MSKLLKTLQETQEELSEKYFLPTDGGISVSFSGRPEKTGNELSIDEFVEQAQIKAVKAAMEEIKLDSDKRNDIQTVFVQGEISGYNQAIEDLNQNIDKLLKEL